LGDTPRPLSKGLGPSALPKLLNDGEHPINYFLCYRLPSINENAEIVLINPLYPPVLGDFRIWGTPPIPRQRGSAPLYTPVSKHPPDPKIAIEINNRSKYVFPAQANPESFPDPAWIPASAGMTEERTALSFIHPLGEANYS